MTCACNTSCITMDVRKRYVICCDGCACDVHILPWPSDAESKPEKQATKETNDQHLPLPTPHISFFWFLFGATLYRSNFLPTFLYFFLFLFSHHTARTGLVGQDKHANKKSTKNAYKYINVFCHVQCCVINTDAELSLCPPDPHRMRVRPRDTSESRNLLRINLCYMYGGGITC